jgi:heptosyltransferase-1
MSARSRILVIKTSSLGDVVHALPAISDVAASERDWSIDWVCEETFADIPGLHHAVDRVIPSAIRRWRRTWWAADTRAEFAAFNASLKKTSYDAVLDLQGLLKSALIARMARGPRHGFAWNSTRERLASLAYGTRHVVPWDQHAIARNRQLTAAALGTRADGPMRYGIVIAPAPSRGDSYVVALHATSRADKLWPEQNWRWLLTQLSEQGIRAVLPWGDDAERARSLRLALDIRGASVPERMRLRELATLLAGATCAVGVDTGLMHLAAAVGVPALCLFVATDPALTGVEGERAPAVNLGGNGAMPDVTTVYQSLKSLLSTQSSGRPAQ